MRIVGNLQGPTRYSRDILLQAKGITGIESTQIRWLRDDPAGEAGPVEHRFSGGQESQTRGRGTV
jgi:hypothetical protein